MVRAEIRDVLCAAVFASALLGCGGAGGPPAIDREALMDPRRAAEQAPAEFRVAFETTQGRFVVEAHRDWAPLGVERFYNLVRIGYLVDIACFRVVPGFVVQFGIHGEPAVAAIWENARIPDDSVQQPNKRGTLTFAKTRDPNTRTTQLFINLADNANLDRMGFAPFARVVEGMDVVDRLYSGYGENGPDQGQFSAQGNEYVRTKFAKIDFIKWAILLE